MSNAKIIEKIRALRARAENEASSAEEVAAAASRAAKLMMEHEITEIDLADKSSGVEIGRFHKGRRDRHPALRMVAPGIHHLTECQVYWQQGSMVIAGLQSDKEFAVYLIELILAASERAWKLARDQRGLSGAVQRKSYLLGFGEAVCRNLLTLARERKAKRATATGTDLVPVKEAVITDHMNAEFKISQDREYKPRSINQFAGAVGSHDGRRLNLNRPVEGKDQPQGLL